MVTRKKYKLVKRVARMASRKAGALGKKIARWRRSKSPWRIHLLLFLMFVSIVSSARAGDLKNSGTINNSGTLRIKNQAIGLPMVNNGVLEFNGGSQTIPAKTYQNLALSGTGTKTTNGGEVTVSDTLAIAAGVTLVTQAGFDVHLQSTGELKENGYLLGSINKTVNLNGATTSSNFGNIGATVSWIGAAPGTTTVTRTTGVISTSTDPLFAGKQSIKRYFDVAPTFGTGLNGAFIFKYADIELNGQDPNTLTLWRSPDGGNTWRKQGGTVNTVQRTITKTGILSFSRWTASDAANPLGSSFIEGVASNLALTSGNGQTGVANTNLASPFIVTVTDGYGNPIPGINVTFAIGSVPSGATGQVLTVLNATTGVTGQASTILHLGSAAGTYTVTATSVSLAGSPITFTASTSSGGGGGGGGGGLIATSVVATAGINQIGQVAKALPDSIAVQVRDQFGASFAGAMVKFAIVDTPNGSIGQQLSDTLVTTNSAGLAWTKLTLGSKVGVYKVQASSGSLTGSPITFSATAIAGPARILALASGNNQFGNVKKQLTQPFVVTVTDTFGNVVKSTPVQFNIASMPFGASGQSLSKLVDTTDVNGKASTVLTLGDSAGVYKVNAASATLLGSPLTFTATAVGSSKAAKILLASGNNQIGQVTKTLDRTFVVTARDSADKPVAGVNVSFTIAERPAGATGDSVIIIQSVTDTFGLAIAQLRLGTKAGVYRVNASAPGLTGSPITFTANAVAGAAASLAFISGSGQTGLVSTRLNQPFVVFIHDGFGNAVRGVTVTFVVDSIPTGANGWTVIPTSTTTDSLGVASAFLTLGDVAGVYRVQAASTGLSGSPIVFRATATTQSGATRLAYVAGNNQSAPILTQLLNPLVVSIVDASGKPIQNQTVTFSVDSIPAGAVGFSTPISVQTDASGIASATLKLGSKVGIYRLVATSAGIADRIEFRVRATVGPARILAYLAGNNQTKTVANALDLPFEVRITDEGGNVVPGASVRFALDSIPTGSTGQQLSVVNATTDTLGRASTVLTLGTKVGLYYVSASATALAGSPIQFTARATAGNAALLALFSGDNQSADPGTNLKTPFSVVTTDAFGNPVQGINVQFALTSAPQSATGQRISVTSVTSDVDGRASTLLTLGNKIGDYKVIATSTGLGGSPVTFTGSATILLEPTAPNRLLNIADLTSVIDHVLGKIVLTGVDSVIADADKDGRITVKDVITVRAKLLEVPETSGSASKASLSKSVAFTNTSFIDSTDDVKGEFVITENGVRFNMTNKVPVKAMQLIVHLKNPINIQGVDMVFDRAKMDSFYVNTKGTEMRIVAYNLENNPIIPDSGALFRLPIRFTDIAELVGGEVFVSKKDNIVQADRPTKGTVDKRKVIPSDNIPIHFILHQNYPNPFNAGTTINYEVADVPGVPNVVIQVYNVLGEKIKTLVSAPHATGRYSIYWDGSDDHGTKVASGTYYYRLISGDFVSGKKMILLK
ncbi:MAG: Ig-like domain-containing protein [Ignavibacteriales bacterium]|nr:Ig-like domain-containing protein [Ignavibacteriales bacterium]